MCSHESKAWHQVSQEPETPTKRRAGDISEHKCFSPKADGQGPDVSEGLTPCKELRGTWPSDSGPSAQWPPGGWVGSGWAHLGVEHVDTEVAEGCLEEVVLGAVLEEGAVHGSGPHLWVHGGCTVSSQQAARGPGSLLGTEGLTGGWVCAPRRTPANPGTQGQGGRDQPREAGNGYMSDQGPRHNGGGGEGVVTGPGVCGPPQVPKMVRGGPTIRPDRRLACQGQRGGRLKEHEAVTAALLSAACPSPGHEQPGPRHSGEEPEKPWEGPRFPDPLPPGPQAPAILPIPSPSGSSESSRSGVSQEAP